METLRLTVPLAPAANHDGDAHYQADDSYPKPIPCDYCSYGIPTSVRPVSGYARGVWNGDKGDVSKEGYAEVIYHSDCARELARQLLNAAAKADEANSERTLEVG